MNINEITPRSGRMIKEDGSIVNIADRICKEPDLKELGKIDYSEFTAGGTVTKHFLRSLNRQASKRVIVLYNTMDVNISTQRFTMNDSFFGDITRTSGSTATSIQTVANNGCIQVIDGSSFQLAGNQGSMLDMPVDSIHISFTVGSTAPIKGELEIGLIEVFK